MDFENHIKEIVKVIRDREDREMALAFTNVIGLLLRENGVMVKTSRYEFETDNETDKNKCIIEKEFGISIDGLDFTEHDKVFENKIAELEKRIQELDTIDAIRNDEKTELKRCIAELKSRNNQLTESILRKETKIHELETRGTVELPFDPLEAANMLINATYMRKVKSMDKFHCSDGYMLKTDMYSIDDLEQIAEHLLVYCKHNKESEE